MKKCLDAKNLARILFTIALALSASGCELVGGLGDGLGVNDLSLLGVQPAADYAQTGNIEVSMLPVGENNRVSLASLQSLGLRAEVEDESGEMKECEFVEEETREASIFNSVAMLIDDSGSMGLEYDPEVCETCPHDPENVRAEAAEKLAGVVFREAPTSHISVFDFGPDPEPDSGYDAIRVLADFSSDPANVEAAIKLVDGTQEVGTPLWDALAETIEALAADAAAQDQDLMEGDHEGQTCGCHHTEPDEPEPELETRRYIVVLSDGADTFSQRHDLESVIELARANEITVYAIGLGPACLNATNSRGESVAEESTVDALQRLAEATDGFYAAAGDAAALRALYEHIGQAMAEGYKTVTFDCNDGEAPGGGAEGPRHVRGNLLMGNFVSVPFGFLEQ